MKKVVRSNTVLTAAILATVVIVVTGRVALGTVGDLDGNNIPADGLQVDGVHPNALWSECLRVVGGGQWKMVLDDSFVQAGASYIRMRDSNGVCDFGYSGGNSYVKSSRNVVLRAGQRNAPGYRDSAEVRCVVGDGNVALVVKPDGKVGINNPNPASVLDVGGMASVDVLEIKGADLAERFAIASPNGAEIVPGAVTCIDPDTPGGLVISRNAYDRTVAGVISGAGGLRAGMRMGQSGTLADGEHLVSLTGRVYVQAVGGEEGIQIGDMLTTSNVPGRAMAVANYERAQGAILGKAMTTLKPGEQGMVLALITLQ